MRSFCVRAMRRLFPPYYQRARQRLTFAPRLPVPKDQLAAEEETDGAGIGFAGGQITRFIRILISDLLSPTLFIASRRRQKTRSGVVGDFD